MPWRGRQVAILVLRRMGCLSGAEASGWAGALVAQISEPLGICGLSLAGEKDQLPVLSLVLPMGGPWVC